MFISSTIKKALQYLLAKRGFSIVPSHSTFLYQRNHLVKILEIKQAIDAGANVGQWGMEMRKSGFKNQIVSFEPDDRAVSKLKKIVDDNWSVEKIALSDKKGSLNFYKWDLEGGSSSLNTLTNFGEDFTSHHQGDLESVTVSTERLDNFLTLKQDSLLKIDVQGHELQVLKGAEGLFPYISLIEIEIPLIPVYKDAAMLPEIIVWLEERGYVLCSVQTERWSDFGAADTDALFVGKDKYDNLLCKYR